MGRPPDCNCCGGKKVGYWAGYNTALWKIGWPAEATIVGGVTDLDVNTLNLSVLVMGVHTPVLSGWTPAVPSSTTETSTFVNDGGTLVMFTDYRRSSPTAPTIPCNVSIDSSDIAMVNTVMSGIGSSMSWTDTANPSPSCAGRDAGPFAPVAHALTSGVSNIQLQGPGYITVGSGTTLLNGTNPVIAFETVGSGRVFLIGDVNTVTDASSPTYDMDVFLSNIYDTA